MKFLLKLTWSLIKKPRFESEASKARTEALQSAVAVQCVLLSFGAKRTLFVYMTVCLNLEILSTYLVDSVRPHHSAKRLLSGRSLPSRQVLIQNPQPGSLETSTDLGSNSYNPFLNKPVLHKYKSPSQQYQQQQSSRSQMNVLGSSSLGQDQDSFLNLDAEALGDLFVN